MFGDKNVKKDHKEIINAITELQKRPTKQQLETLKQEKDKEIATLKQDKTNLTSKLQEQATETKKAQDRIKTLEIKKFWLESDLSALESNVKFRTKVNQEKDKEIDTLKQEKTTLEKNSSNLALDLEKAQDQIKTLESNENTLKNDLNAKEKTINELKKQIQDLEYKYTQERERMKAENKRLQEQGLDKRYTQKDYEALKAEHNKQIEALKKKIQEQDKTIKKNNTYRRNAENAKNKQIQQRRKMMPPLRPTPQPTYTPTKRI